MANSRVFKQQLCNMLASETIQNWDFENLESESFAEKEGVVDLIWAMYQKHHDSPQLSHLLQSRKALHLRFKNTLKQVLFAMTEADIPVICMRGIALEPYYKDKISLRPQSDIDLLFRKSDILQAKQVLGDLGFKPSHNYSNVFVRGTIQLDLHTDPLGIERIKSWSYITPLRAENFFESAEESTLSGEPALITSDEVMLPYLSFHALKHSFERLIWMYDIALLAKYIEGKQTWGCLEENITQLQLERPCYYALAYTKQHLNAPVPDELLKSIQPKMGFIERRLFKRFMNHEVIPYLAERLFARMQPSFKHRMEFWRETIYPSYEVRAQIADGSCVKCSFIRKRFKQLGSALWAFVKETFYVIKA